MALAPDARLGPYEILSLIGVGGMGEVYKARDTRLDRIVAIKLLPPEVATRADRRARFESEIRAIASLNHPHICTVFDVGEQDGLAFLVMEYLDGETLNDRLSQGPLPADDVLRYASQIADALDHAHHAHVTHRDVKPSNVMLTPQGAKLLDFGLARSAAVDVTTPGSTVTLSAGRLTVEGTIVGTFQYMAPEQLEGKEADHRTDVFAFGMLLFEMATGRKAFEADSQASLIASILTRQPPPVSATRSAGGGTLPPELDHIVERCLAKNPAGRWQTARDVKLELEWIVSSAARLITASEYKRSRRYGRLWLGAAVAAVVPVAVAWLLTRPQQRTGDIVRFAVALPSGTVIARGPVATRIALSPDGRHLAFVTTAAGVDRLLVQSLDSLTAVAVADGAESPFWSPDSRFIGFFAPSEGQIKRVALTGGPARVICSAAIIDAPVWHSNGTILFAQADTGIFRVSADGGAPIQLTRLDSSRQEINHMWPEWLPDGQHFLYTATSLDAGGKRAPRAVYVRSLDADDRRLLAHADSRMMYSAPGYLLRVDQGALLAQTFDVRTLALAGEPIKIADDVAYTRTNGNAGFSVSATGVLAYYSGVALSDLTTFDRAGRRTESTWLQQAFSGSVRVSPDGEQVMVDLQDSHVGASDVWMYDLSRRVPTRFTTDPASETNPVWSPDSRRVVYSSDGGGSPDLYSKATDGIGSDDRILSMRGPQVTNDWSPDGQFIVFEDNSRETGLDLWLLPMQGDRTARPLIRTRFQEWGARLSPDGAWVAFVSNDTGASEVYVAAMRGSGDKKTRISTAGGIAPRWRRDGQELFYVATETNSIMAVGVTTRPTFKAGPAAALFSIRVPDSRRRAREVAYDVLPDGQRFLVNTPLDQPSATGMTVVLNWPTALPH